MLLSACSVQLFGGEEYFDPNDPNNMALPTMSDRGSPEAEIRGWSVEWGGAIATVQRPWDGYQVWVRINDIHAKDLDFTIDWDVVGGPPPYFYACEDYPRSCVVAKRHVCENNSATLTVRASDGSSFQRMVFQDPGAADSGACIDWCGGKISNCPYCQDPPGPPPANMCNAELDALQGLINQYPCAQYCLDDLVVCMNKHGCDATSCIDPYQSCVASSC